MIKYQCKQGHLFFDECAYSNRYRCVRNTKTAFLAQHFSSINKTLLSSWEMNECTLESFRYIWYMHPKWALEYLFWAWRIERSKSWKHWMIEEQGSTFTIDIDVVNIEWVFPGLCIFSISWSFKRPTVQVLFHPRYTSCRSSPCPSSHTIGDTDAWKCNVNSNRDLLL